MLNLAMVMVFSEFGIYLILDRIGKSLFVVRLSVFTGISYNLLILSVLLILIVTFVLDGQDNMP